MPAISISLLVLIYPLVNGVLLAFTDYSLVRQETNFVGLQNFRALFTSSRFWLIFGNSLGIAFVSVGLQIVAGMTLALLLNQHIPFREGFRALVFVIWVLPMIVVSLLWLVSFNSDFGIVNALLRRLGIIDENISWFASPMGARATIVLAFAWRGTPFFMVMILAGLQTIPTSLTEAGMIDGASAPQRFWRITLPNIMDIVILAALLSTVRIFQNITFIYTLTGGGPLNATTTLAIDVYRKAFVSFRMGDAAAVGVTWLFFLALIASVYLRRVTRNGL